MALIDLGDDEIRAALRREVTRVQWSANDYLRELDRRAADRHARGLRTLTTILAGATVVYTLATLSLVVVTSMKP
ncbi:MAG: hypothetical protein ACRDGT_02435 [Candidatus Limnocylindria bacterium]